MKLTYRQMNRSQKLMVMALIVAVVVLQKVITAVVVAAVVFQKRVTIRQLIVDHANCNHEVQPELVRLR